MMERSEVRYGNTTIDYRIVRSNRRATVAIAIDPRNGVLVTAPSPTTVARLDTLVRAKASWIALRLRRQADRTPPATREFVSGETFHYLGRQHRLRVDIVQRPHPLVRDGRWLRVFVPRGLAPTYRAEYVRAALVDWYTANARRKLSQRVRIWAKRVGVEPSAVELGDQRKRWGSASSGSVRLNWRIVQAPLSLIDYVVAHELTHLRHPNHAAAFWAALGRVMPDYDVRKARLRVIGSNFEW
jgi:predicted metal-dependent hydrolase